MLKIEKKLLQGELKYKGTVIVTYKIQYPQIISHSYPTYKFNILNEQKAFALEKYAKETLFSDSKEQYDYNLSHGYPIMVYELILQTTITCNQLPILSLYQDEYTYTGRRSWIDDSKFTKLEFSLSRAIFFAGCIS